MFGKRVSLFKLFGFEVKMDMSWLIIAVFLTWSLAKGFFPLVYEGLPETTYWWMGFVGAMGLFGSIIFHEFFHSFVARKNGMAMKGITLFIFGGVSEMADEPLTARSEFSMAIAGPLSSVALSLGFYGILLLGRSWSWPLSVDGVFNYLMFVNALLAGFNLLPAFPLDGGRVLRSALWQWKKNLRWATRIASRIGSAFGVLMIVLGVANIMFGSFVAGFWWFLIGLFLRNASNVAYQNVLTRRALEGERVERFMRPATETVTVSPNTSVETLIEDYIYKHDHKMYPVRSNGDLLGCVNVDEVKNIPREQWSQHTVSEMARECSPDNTIGPKKDAVQALSTMQRSGTKRLMVVDQDKLVGVITLNDLLEFLAQKVDLEEEPERIQQ